MSEYTDMTESILATIKNYLSIPTETEDFDPVVQSFINDTLSYVSHDLGVGPKEGFRISGYEETWDDFLEDPTLLNDVRSLIYLRVRIIFDPPQVAAVISAYERQIDEYEWRINSRKEEREWRHHQYEIPLFENSENRIL